MKIIVILDEDYLLRRIPLNNPNFIKPDGTICSYAFKPKDKNSNEISVNIKKLSTYQSSVIDNLKFCLTQVKAKTVRENDLECIHTPEPLNYSHASITGKFTNSISKNLARSSIVINESLF